MVFKKISMANSKARTRIGGTGRETVKIKEMKKKSNKRTKRTSEPATSLPCHPWSKYDTQK